MRIRSLLTVAVVALAALQIGVGLAQSPPTRAFGALTINGAPAPAGTEVKAFIGDVQCGVRTTVADGTYVVDIDADATTSGCGLEGASIRFTVNGVNANETGTFSDGSFLQLDLTVSGDAPPAAPPPPADGDPGTPPPAADPPPADPMPPSEG